MFKSIGALSCAFVFSLSLLGGCDKAADHPAAPALPDAPEAPAAPVRPAAASVSASAAAAAPDIAADASAGSARAGDVSVKLPD